MGTVPATRQRVNYTRQEQINIQRLNAFLNPPRPAGMPDYAYKALKDSNAKAWNTFVNMHQSRHQ